MKLCFRILIIELNENVLQTHSNNQIMVISMHRLLNSLQAVRKNNINKQVNISWSKVLVIAHIFIIKIYN